MHSDYTDDVTEPAVDRRSQPRVDTRVKVWLKHEDGRHIEFWTKNISRSGFCLEPNDWPYFKGPITLNVKPLHVVMFLTLNENTTKMYHLNAYLRHRSDAHGCGFFFTRKVNV